MTGRAAVDTRNVGPGAVARAHRCGEPEGEPEEDLMAGQEPDPGGRLLPPVGGGQPGQPVPDGRWAAMRGLRVSDAERHAVSEMLREAAGEGRLSVEELEERLEGAYRARTYAELETLVADLPSARAPAPVPDRGPMVLQTSLGDVRQRGHWVVPRHITAKTALGSITIDFSEAVCQHREIVVEATTGAGVILMIVPRGWSVRTDEVTTSMGSVVNKATDPADRDAPVLRVVGHTGVGTIKVRYPFPRLRRRRRP